MRTPPETDRVAWVAIRRSLLEVRGRMTRLSPDPDRDFTLVLLRELIDRVEAQLPAQPPLSVGVR